MNRRGSLDELSEEIAACRICDTAGMKVTHGPALKRGASTKILVIGEQPGKTELEKGVAFSGPAGKRLVQWLIQAGIGNSRQELFSRIYFTSLCKCMVSSSDFPRAVKHCYPYLERQIDMVSPTLVITLGQRPLKYIFRSKQQLDDLVGSVYSEADIAESASLISFFPKGCLIAPLPHPSPLSRWLNSASNTEKLNNGLLAIKGAL